MPTLVSVIIPTTARPVLVQRALRSALGQTHRELEVIVVVDGPNPETLAVLDQVDDPRLHVLHNPQAAGAGAARNRGAAIARGAWLAFLDDDDEWMPQKIERQLAVAEGEGGWAIVSCCCRVVTPLGNYTWPRQLFDGSIPVDEYLFDRKTIFRGDTALATASLLVSKAIFDRTQFGTTRQNEDTTMLLRVTKEAGGRMTMMPDPLVVLYQEEDRESLGSSYSWRDMLAWLDSMQGLFTKRAYSGFCLIYLGSQAARHHDFVAFFILLARSIRHGHPRPMHLMAYVSFWLVPIQLRRRIRAWAGSLTRLPAPRARTGASAAG